MSELITNKLQELIALAKAEGEPNVQIVLFALCGARESGDCHILAEMTQAIVKEVLIPRLDEKRSARDN